MSKQNPDSTTNFYKVNQIRSKVSLLGQILKISIGRVLDSSIIQLGHHSDQVLGSVALSTNLSRSLAEDRFMDCGEHYIRLVHIYLHHSDI